MTSDPGLRQPTPPREPAIGIRAAARAAELWQRIPDAVTFARGRYLRLRAGRKLRSAKHPLWLCLGSGRAPIPNWTNVDYYFPADVVLDLRFGLPLPDHSVEYIYSEHLVEHMPLEGALALFNECHRVLRTGGRMRVATPDLADIVRDYRSDWRRHEWVNWDQYRWIDSGTRMVNAAVREWGHQYLWDFEELEQRLQSTGFRRVTRHGVGESEVAAMRGLETRADSRLVVEAEP